MYHLATFLAEFHVLLLNIIIISIFCKENNEILHSYPSTHSDIIIASYVPYSKKLAVKKFGK